MSVLWPAFAPYFTNIKPTGAENIRKCPARTYLLCWNGRIGPFVLRWSMRSSNSSGDNAKGRDLCFAQRSFKQVALCGGWKLRSLAYQSEGDVSSSRGCLGYTGGFDGLSLWIHYRKKALEFTLALTPKPIVPCRLVNVGGSDVVSSDQ